MVPAYAGRHSGDLALFQDEDHTFCRCENAPARTALARSSWRAISLWEAKPMRVEVVPAQRKRSHP
jgi:hypothetical protein